MLPLPVIYAVCGILVAYLNSRFVTHEVVRIIGWIVAGAFLLVAALDLLGVRAG